MRSLYGLDGHVKFSSSFGIRYTDVRRDAQTPGISGRRDIARSEKSPQQGQCISVNGPIRAGRQVSVKTPVSKRTACRNVDTDSGQPLRNRRGSVGLANSWEYPTMWLLTIAAPVGRLARAEHPLAHTRGSVRECSHRSVRKPRRPRWAFVGCIALGDAAAPRTASWRSAISANPIAP